MRDLRNALRVLRRSPAFSITAVLLLALTIGANAAMFSVIEAVLLRPLPYRESNRLCVLWKSVPARNIEWDWTSYPAVRDWREQNRAFEDLAFVLRPEASVVTLRIADVVENVQASKVSGNFFDILGTAPLTGRTFSREEWDRGTASVVLSYGFWQNRFGGDRGSLGRTLQIDNYSATIIGVMPPSFHFPDKAVQLWMLVSADSRWTAFQRVRVADAFFAIGRLRRGVAVEQARVEMSAVAGRLGRQYPDTDQHLAVRVVPIFQQIAGAQVRRALWVLGCAVFCVLLIACSNIAGLLVARGAARKKELAVRAALGAGRAQLVWLLTTENLVLSLMGGAAGLLVAWAALKTTRALFPVDLPRSEGIGLNATVFAFTSGVCILTGLMFGLLPALQLARAGAGSRLPDGGRGSSEGPAGGRFRGWLVAAQFALAIVLLTGAGLLLRSFILLNSVKPGYDTSHLLTLPLQLPEAGYPDAERRRAFADETVRRLEALPGVRGAALGSALDGSFRGHVPNQSLTIEGRPATQDVERHARYIVSDKYFRVLGIRLSQGRPFSHEDIAGGPGVAVINERMARRFWPSENPIGKRFKQILPGMDSPWNTVVGVVGDAIYNRDGTVVPVFYLSVRQWNLGNNLDLVVRTEMDPMSLAPAVRSTIRSIDSAVPYFEVDTVEHRIEELDRPRRLQTGLIVGFAGVALVLAALGLHGLMRYSVEQRTREIGIRMALGATPGQVTQLVLRQGMRWAVTGVLVGLAGAIAFGRAISSWLFGIGPADPLTLAIVVGVLGAVAMLACGIPTLRAARVDPVEALRHE